MAHADMQSFYDLIGDRFICDVLSEMRECWKTRNFALLPSLIEECQTLANRMESRLGDRRHQRDILRELPILKDEVRTLREEKEDLEADIKILKKDRDRLRAKD